ncbi:uncharacterized protein LOC122519114 [Polistes fuscatus]|uniref:uncharacterized protein LOC122519114 n=1 Tax=Polistes fuscatus TaxID=30207 RepID=UPI001CAA2B10|nr:uncharacterized protein LOC122519114 [Polistes fuscatus]
MWLLLLIIMADAIIGTPNVENTDLIQQTLEDFNKDINSAELLHMSFNNEKDNDIQKGINKRFVEGSKSNFWYVLKNSEIQPTISLLYLPTNKRSLKFNEPEEIKNPFFSRCDGKRVSHFRSSKNERPIRMPFNSWGGKRGRLDDPANFLTMKGSKSFSDKDFQQSFYEYVKRLPNFGRRTPFYSWGGKRSINSEFDLNKNVDNTSEEKSEFYLPNEDTTEDTILDEIEDEKRAALMKTSRSRIGFNSWGGKRNNDKEFHLPVTNESINSEDIIDRNINPTDQLQILEKKAINEYSRRFHFHPWGGKRSTNAEDVIIPNNYGLYDNDPAKERKVFFPWNG